MISSIILGKSGFLRVGTVFARSYAVAASNSVSLETNKKTEANRLEKTLSKFWENITVHKASDAIEVRLDDKCLRTPLGNNLVLPKSKSLLAELIAIEWRNLPNLQIKPHQLPLTSITARALDLQHNNGDNKVGSRDLINEELLKYLDTDTLLVFSPSDEFEGALREEQDKLYLPIMKEVEQYLTEFHPEKTPLKLSYLDSGIDGIRSNRQTRSTQIAATNFMNSLNVWEFVAFEMAVMTSKSFICGIYTVKLMSPEDMKLELEDIIRACTLETIYQTERWGEVEDTHDVEKENIRRCLTSAVLLAYNSREN